MRGMRSRFLKDESGATAIEYAVIISGVAIVIVASVGAVGVNLNNIFNSASVPVP